MRSIRFDPGYVYQSHYGLGDASPEDQKKVIDGLLKEWKRHRINRVYVLVANPVYGTFFKTEKVPHQHQEKTLGSTRFIDDLIRAAAKKGIESYGWVYILQSKAAWEANPSWRFRCSVAKPESDPNLFLLDIGNLQARDWYTNVVYEALDAYPKLKGIDLAEPMTSNLCPEDDQSGRAQVMVDYLKWMAGQIKARKKALVLTPHLPAHPDGKLFTNEELRKTVGIDLIRMTKEVPMEAFYPQLLFQEGRPKTTLPPEWTKTALLDVRKRIGKTARLGVHLELGSDFTHPGAPPISYGEVARAVKASKQVPGLVGIDFYSSDLATKMKPLP